MNIKYTSTGQRQQVLSLLENNKYSRVLDIGGTLDNWASKYVTHVVDINSPNNVENIIYFSGDLGLPEVWTNILEDVKKNGKFDFVICTHTLEDLRNPQTSLYYMEKIAAQGFIAVPSKYVESGRWGTYFRGWIHHRWIFNIEDEKLILYPKLNFTEYLSVLDTLASQHSKDTEELQFFWKEKIDWKTISEDFFHSDQSIINLYNNLL
jgi:hypothetical protein